MTIDKDYIINDLGSNSTFYDWFIKENTEIIEKLNMLKVFNIEGVNGITAPVATNGVASIGLSGKVDDGISFNGPAYFNNFAAIPNIAVKVPQINSTVGGFTFGTPVRVYWDITTNTVKYEPARANDPDQAEVMGVISSITSTHAYVTLLGKIDGDFSQVNTRGIGLTAGWIYFLDPGVTGNITDFEPVATGYVSKPVIMGLTGDSGLVLQMRGNYLNPLSIPAGISGSNSIILACDADLRPKVDVGIFVSMYTMTNTQKNNYFSARRDINGDPLESIPVAKILNTLIPGNPQRNIYLAPSLASVSNGYYSEFLEERLIDFDGFHILGIIEEITTDGTYFYYKILTNGFTTTLPKGLKDYYNFTSGSNTNNIVYLNTYYDPSLEIDYLITAYDGDDINLQCLSDPANITSHCRVGFLYDDKFLVSIQDSPTSSKFYCDYYECNSSGILAQSTSINNGSANNILINGNFNIWQRNNIGKYNSYTNTGNIIFADMWRRRDGITGDNSTKSYYIVRRSLDEYQTDIEGNPEYYIDVKAIGLSAQGISGISGGYTLSDHFTIGHVIPGAKYFDKNTLKFKFYGKCSSSGYPVDVYLSRYSGNQLIDYINLGTISLTSTWDYYNISYYLPELENNGVAIDLENDYCEIGVDLIRSIELANINGITLGQDLYFSLASFSANVGSYPASIYPDYPEQLKYCQQFYYSTYDKDQNIGTQTMSDITTPTQNVESIFLQPNKSCNLFKWPTRMRVAPSVTFYSPYSGLSGRAYNKTASTESTQFDTINTSGTIGYNNQIRNGNNASISGTPTVHGVNVCLSNGYVLYDEVHFHIIADADFTL